LEPFGSLLVSHFEQRLKCRIFLVFESYGRRGSSVFALATANRRLALAFDAWRPADAPAKRRGRPYSHRLTRHTLGEADKDKVLYVART
jgi:hypothetical protein